MALGMYTVDALGSEDARAKEDIESLREELDDAQCGIDNLNGSLADVSRMVEMVKYELQRLDDALGYLWDEVEAIKKDREETKCV